MTGAPARLLLRQQRQDLARALEQADVGELRRDVRDAGAMREHVAQRDLALAVLAELREVAHDRIVEVQEPALIAQVHEHRGDHLRRREQVEQRAGRRDDPLGVVVVERRVAAQVADRAIEDDLAAAADAQREGGVEPGAIRADRRAPDRLDVGAVAADRARIDLGGARRYLLRLGDVDERFEV
ncbi:MAG: hypothetical protein NT062_06820 [Proteobacteria bacterium]|nr:hypothetical protein [Pseudomonadota bacterium]